MFSASSVPVSVVAVTTAAVTMILCGLYPQLVIYGIIGMCGHSHL
jgi:hypothetical protein